MKNFRYILSYSEVSKAKVICNIIQFLYYKLKNKHMVMKKIYKNKMILDLRTPGISKTLFLYGKRELLETQVIINEIRDGMNVLDIGANIGYYAILEASLLESGKVYAFEPDPRNIEVLKKNIKLNKFSNRIKLYPYAVAEKNGTRKFYLSPTTNLSGFLKRDKKSNFALIKCIRLDSFDQINKIDFIRMDIEGYESMAIDGMMNFLKTTKRLKLQIEVHSPFYNDGKFDFQKRLKTLEKIGFHVKYLVSAELAEPAQIVKSKYKPIKTVKEGRWSHGLYQNIKMKDLLTFLNNDRKIVRSILLEKN